MQGTQILAGWKTYGVAVLAIAFAAYGYLFAPAPYHLTLDQAIGIVTAALGLGALRSGLQTEVEKILAALGIPPGTVKSVADAAARARAALAKTVPILFAIVVVAPLLTGCALFGPATPGTETPATRVFEAKGYFLAGLAIANAYGDLPPCPTVIVCKDATIMSKVKIAAHTAKDALDAADTIVNDPALKDGDKAKAAADAAFTAVTAFQAITIDLKTK